MDIDIGRLQSNVAEVRERIAAACARAGRPAGDVTLVAVTKSVGPDAADALIELGVTDIGENRAQPALAKAGMMARAGDVRWHMIGHLQRNKVRHAMRLFGRIHSVDSERLAREIDRVAAGSERVVPVFLEVSISGEAGKFGLTPGEAVALAGQASGMPHVAVEGLMTMAPFGAPEGELRAVFAGLRELAARIAAEGFPNVSMQHLSMGMSQDYELAVEEGATMVRVGSALFVQGGL